MGSVVLLCIAKYVLLEQVPQRILNVLCLAVGAPKISFQSSFHGQHGLHQHSNPDSTSVRRTASASVLR